VIDKKSKKRGIRLFRFAVDRVAIEARLAHWAEPYWTHIDSSGDEPLTRIDWVAAHSSIRPDGGSVHAVNIGPLLVRVAIVEKPKINAK
jgi:hypothetical protein